MFGARVWGQGRSARLGLGRRREDRCRHLGRRGGGLDLGHRGVVEHARLRVRHLAGVSG